MKYTSINIQGNLISEEILQKIEAADAQGQLAKDFGFEPGVNLRSEIEYAWSRIKLDWKHFYERTEKLPASDPYGTTLSRRWMTGFFNTLGFELSLQKASLQGDNEQQYSISHTCDLLDGLPVHIAGFYDTSRPEKNTLDIRSSGGASKFSPHATIQEYLNVTEHLYAIVTNGHLLRLVRDSGRLVKLTYIEFDLKRLLDEDKYSEFTLLYRLLHASRFPRTKQETDESLLEKYYQDSIESGNRIREGLSGAVKLSLIALGNGLLEHPENEELRERISLGRPNPRDFYHQLLRLIYRLLFLMVTEERDLIFAEIQDDNQEPDLDDLLKGVKRPTKKQKEIYYQFYSLVRLRKLSEKRYLQENQYTDLWQGLMQTFALFESGGTGSKIGILALGSELFSGNAMPDITSSKMNNKVLLQCIRSLNEFEDAKHNLSYINYRALDVEELGSVYEGLLELEPVFEWENEKPKFSFKKGTERSSSGSHYTPEDLVKPLIQHSLEYLIEERTADFYKEKATEAETKKKLLDLKVCDVACGSGHILLSAARRIALEVARVETGEQQPNPTSFRHALKEVIRNCIYGVDKNPLAVELCKVALWLESHNPGEPLSFLDHRIKCGDAIVGLAHREELQYGIANEAYKKLPGDEKEVVSAFLKKNKQERALREKSMQAVQLTTETDYKLMEQVRELNKSIEHFSNLPENTPEEIEQKEKAYNNLINSDTLKRLKIMADLQIMPFFLEKTESNKEYLVTDSLYNRYLRGEIQTPFRLEIEAIETATNYRFFHWFLEFPEVSQQGGFDCVLGNPPFLGDKKLKSAFGNNFLEYVKYSFNPIGAVDLVIYFFRRIFNIINQSGFLSLISTNTVAQGNARVGGLEIIIKSGGSINHAVRSMKWPGKAAVEVALVSITKQEWKRDFFLGSQKVEIISSYLNDLQSLGSPFTLKISQQKSFIGSYVLGDGFVLSNKEADALLNKNSINKDVLFPFLNGVDLNSDPMQRPSRWVINFFGWPEKRMSQPEWEELDLNSKSEINKKIHEGRTILVAPYDYKGKVATDYPDCYDIVLRSVKPERQRWALDKDGNLIVGKYVVRDPMPQRWWIYGEKRPGLYNAIADKKQVLVIALTSKTVGFSFIVPEIVFSHATVVIATESFYDYCILQSNLHHSWVVTYASKMKNDQRYTPSDCFENFPFPKNLGDNLKFNLNSYGETYHDYRKQLMSKLQLGLTKTYNAFHGRRILNTGLTFQVLKELDRKTIEEKYSKEVWNLWNHLQKTPGACSIEEAVKGIMKLRRLHVEMDNAVLDTYNWKDIDLKHDFYEVDYLPEKDRIRFTIHPDARKEVLKRLLELNHKIHEEEVKAGLWDKKKTGKQKIVKSNQVNEGEVGYGGLFG